MLNKTIHINPTFGNECWELYSGVKGYKRVIRMLNSTLKKCVNSGLQKTETRAAMLAVMYAYSDFGASDTEPRNFLSHILEIIYD